MPLWVLSACLVNNDLYRQRMRALTDNDGDGYSDDQGDCDDNDADTFPGAVELCDGVDQDCDRSVDEGAVDAEEWFRDADGDGFGVDPTRQCARPAGHVSQGGDCDDTTAERHPGLAEVAYDAVDQDCDGADLTDLDEDGHAALEVDGDDCDDRDSSVHPEAEELWSNDGVDNDCDGDKWDVVRWTTDQAVFRLEGEYAGGELGRRVAHWSEGPCLFAAAPYADGARGSVVAATPEPGAIITSAAGGAAWGETTGSMLSASLAVTPEGQVVVSQVLDNDGAGTVFLLDGEGLCNGDQGAVDSLAKLIIVGDTASSWFGADAIWLDDIDGDALPELAVTAPAHPGTGANQGAILIWYDPPFNGAVVGAESADAVLLGASDNGALASVFTAADESGPGTPWLVVGGTASVEGGAALYRIPGTSVATGSVADVADGGLVSWVTDRTLAAVDVGDLDFSGSDELVAGTWFFGIWDVADLSGFWDESLAPASLTFATKGEWLTSVAPVGDYDGDGRADFAMLAEDWPAFTERGQLALTPGERAHAGNLDMDSMPMFAEGAQAGDSFAYRVALAQDLDHDGRNELMVAAPGADHNGTGSGAVYWLPLP